MVTGSLTCARWQHREAAQTSPTRARMLGRLRFRLRFVRRRLRRIFVGLVRRRRHRACPTCQASNPPLERSPVIRPSSPVQSARRHSSPGAPETLNNEKSASSNCTSLLAKIPLPGRRPAQPFPTSNKARSRTSPTPPPPLSLPFSSRTTSPTSSTSFPGSTSRRRPGERHTIFAIAASPKLTPISEISQLSLQQLPLKHSTQAQQPLLQDVPDHVRAVRSQRAEDEDSDDPSSTRTSRLIQIGKRMGKPLRPFPLSIGSRSSSAGHSSSVGHSSSAGHSSSGSRSSKSKAEQNGLPDRPTNGRRRGKAASLHAPPDFTPFKYWSIFARIVSHTDWKTALALRRTSRVMREMVERSFHHELWIHGGEDRVDVGFFDFLPNSSIGVIRRRLPFFARNEDDAKGRQAAALWRANSVEISGISSKALNSYLRGLSPRASVLVGRLQGTRRNPLLLPKINSLIVDSFHMRSLRLHASHRARNVYLVCPDVRFRDRTARRTAQLLNPSVRYLYIEVGGRRTAHAIAILFERIKDTKLFPRLTCEMGHRGLIYDWEYLLYGSPKSRRRETA